MLLPSIFFKKEIHSDFLKSDAHRHKKIYLLNEISLKLMKINFLFRLVSSSRPQDI